MNLELLDKNSAYIRIKSDITSNNLTHAYLLIGNDELLRKALFTKLAINILCKRGCQHCSICSQIMSDDYADIKKLDGSDGIKVAQITAINDDIAINPTVGEKKLYFIDNADKLSVQAQNKMLKTLEEPPSYVVFFLGITNLSSMLGTIRSRTKKIYLDALGDEQIKMQLLDAGIEQKLAEIATLSSLGSLTTAYQLAENEEYTQIFESCFELLLTLKNSSQIIEFLYLPIFSKENLPLSLNFLEIILNDVLKISTQSNIPLATKQRSIDTKIIAKGFSPTASYMAINVINNCRKMINSNINSISVTESLLFGILEAKYKWQ